MSLTNYMRSLHNVEFGGSQDALAMSAIGAAAVMTSPYFNGHSLSQIALSMIGGGYLSWRMFAPAMKSARAIVTDTTFESSTPPEYGPGEFDGGLLLGYCTDTGRQLVLSYDLATRHVLLAGQTGVGKTVLGNSLVYQQMQRGGGLLFVDGKMDQANLEGIYQLAAACGREKDLLVLNPGDPDSSNTYNPIIEGTPAEIASRILALQPSTGNNAGADYYRASSFQGVFALVSGLQAAELKFNFLDLSILLQNAKAMEELEEKVKEKKGAGSEEYRAFALFLDQFKTPGKQGAEAQLDMKKMKDVFGGLIARMYMFGSSSFGKVMNTYTPEINLLDAVRNNKIVYVMLPTLGSRDAALALGKMITADLRSCVAELYKLPKDQMPSPAFLAFKDEAGSYASDSWSDLYQQARGAKIILMPAVQTTANMEEISKSFFSTIAGNCWTKIYMKISDQNTAEWAAEFTGMKKKIERSVSRGSNQSSTSDTLRTTPEAKAGSGESFNESFKVAEDYWVTADMLKGLAMGEAFVVMGKRSGERSVYHIKVPYILPGPAVLKEAGLFKLNRLRYTGSHVKGAGFFQNADRYISNVNT